MSIFSLTLLVGSFGGLELDYSRLGYCVVAIVGIYLLYGVHASYHRFQVSDEASAKLSEQEMATAKLKYEPVVTTLVVEPAPTTEYPVPTDETVVA